MPHSPGQILERRYRIVKLLGQGGFGAVYRAWDLNLEIPCALKENLGISSEIIRQFKREASLLSSLRHPNLPKVMDYFLIPGQGQYLVMELIDGDDLQTVLDRSGCPLPEARVLEWSRQILDALDYLHRQTPPIIHRDIKPANIRVNSQGEVFLVDFGIAKTFDPTQRTTLGARAVTPGFSPLEQYGLSGRTDARTDIYAFGATLYTLLTGQPPLDAPERNLQGESLPALHSVQTELSVSTIAAVSTALNMRPSDRFQSVQEMKSALRLFPLQKVGPVNTTQVTPLFAQPATVTGRVGTSKFAWPATLIAGAGLAILLSIILLVGWLLSGDRSPSAAKTTVNSAGALLTPPAIGSEPGLLSPSTATRSEAVLLPPTKTAASPTLISLSTVAPTKTVAAPTWQPTPTPEAVIEKVIDLDNLHSLVSSDTSLGTIACPAFSPDGRRLAAGNSIFDLKTQAVIQSLPDVGVSPGSLVFSPDGRLVAASYFDNTHSDHWVLLFRVDDGAQIQKLTGPPDRFTDLVFSSDGQYLLASNGNDSIYIWNTGDGDVFAKLFGHQDLVSSLAISPDGNWLVSGSYDTNLIVWRNPPKWAQYAVIDISPRFMQMGDNIAFSSDGSLFAVALSSSLTTVPARVLVFETGKVTPKLSIDIAGGGSTSSISFGARNDFLVVALYSASIRFFDLQNGSEVLRKEVGQPGYWKCAAISPDGATIAVATGEGFVQLWTLP